MNDIKIRCCASQHSLGRQTTKNNNVPLWRFFSEPYYRAQSATRLNSIFNSAVVTYRTDLQVFSDVMTRTDA